MVIKAYRRRQKMRKNKFSEIIDVVKETFPQDKWGEEIKARIKEVIPKTQRPEPENESVKIDDHVRATADTICSIHLINKDGGRALISQFVRDESILNGVEVSVKTGEVEKKFDKGNLLGALVAFKVGDELKIGWSAYNKSHEILPFLRKDAVRVAVIRGLVDVLSIDIKTTSISEKWKTGSGIKIPRKIAMSLPDFMDRARKYYAKSIDNVRYV